MSEFATKARALLFDWQQMMNSKDIQGRMGAGMHMFQGGKDLFNAIAHRCERCTDRQMAWASVFDSGCGRLMHTTQMSADLGLSCSHGTMLLGCSDAQASQADLSCELPLICRHRPALVMHLVLKKL